MAKHTSSDLNTHEQAPTGSCGCAEKSPAHDPGRFPSSRPRRTYLSEVGGRRSEVGAAAVAAILLFALPCLALAAGQAAAQTATFDVAPGGILAALAASATSALGTWQFMRRRQIRTDKDRQDVRITPQPVRVSVEKMEEFASKKDFDKLSQKVDRLSDTISEQHAGYAARSDIDRLIEAISASNESSEKRAIATYERINPIAEALAATKQSIENHLADHRSQPSLGGKR